MTDNFILTDTTEDLKDIDVVVYYSVDMPEAETGYGGGIEVLKIRRGRETWSSLEDFKLEHPDFAMEIESKLEDVFTDETEKSAWDHDYRED